jgi:hypothetical protein
MPRTITTLLVQVDAGKRDVDRQRQQFALVVQC